MTATRGRYAATRNPLPRRLLAVAALLAFLAALGLAGAQAVGLDHRSDTCSSVMPDKSCRWLSFLSGGWNGDIGVVNRIYAQ